MATPPLNYLTPEKRYNMTKKKCKKPLEAINYTLAEVHPITETQKLVWKSDKNLMLHGSAGTGKTFLSFYLGFYGLSEGTYNQISVIRSAVPTRDIGYLPGTEQEKSKVYEEPYYNICTELFQRGDAYSNLKEKNIVNFMTTSYIRGLTIDNTFIIVDECQNMTFHELDSIITRVGEGCRIVFCGDFLQSDLVNKRSEQSGIRQFMRILQAMEEFDCFEFGIDDIVRSEFVKNYLIKKHSLEI